MLLFHQELAEGPLLGLIVQHLSPQDRARLALTCRAGRPAALAAPVEKELTLHHNSLASFNTWLLQHIASRGGMGAVQAVCLCADPHGRAGPAACHLARCATKSLNLKDPSPGVLESACTIHTLTRLELDIYDSHCSLTRLGALRQLQSLRVGFSPKHGQGEAPPAWRLSLPALKQLGLLGRGPCTINLDGCSVLREVNVSEGNGLDLTASVPLPHLTLLDLWMPGDLAVAWQHLPALRELVLLHDSEAGLLEGATHLTSLSSLHMDCHGGFVLPPGAWLGSVTRLLLEGFAYLEQDPEGLDWTGSVTGVEELILWLIVDADPIPTAQDIPKIFQWVRWAARLPCLRRVELWAGDTAEADEMTLLCQAAWAEGEDVKAMLGRLLMDLAEAFPP